MHRNELDLTFGDMAASKHSVTRVPVRPSASSHPLEEEVTASELGEYSQRDGETFA